MMLEPESHHQPSAAAARRSGKIHQTKPSAIRNARHYKSSFVLNTAADGPASTNGTHQSGPALPRLANALKSLISSASSGGNGNGSFKSKPAFVDAGDEVIFYSNVAAAPSASAAKTAQNGGAAREGALRRSPSLTRIEKRCRFVDSAEAQQPSPHFSASSSSQQYFSHRQPSTLDQIRQLYKSVPNFSSFDDENEGNCDDTAEQSVPMANQKLWPVSGQNPPPLQTHRRRMPKATAEGASCGTPSNCSAASSLSSANSARSVPAARADGKWDRGQFPTIEQVAEQCEKLVSSSQVLAPPKVSDASPTSSSLTNFSLGSAASSAGSMAEAKTGGQKLSPTDSGYRSRRETPKGGANRGRPLSMLCSGGNENEEIQPKPNSRQFPASSKTHDAPIALRKFIWAEPAPDATQLRQWPFSLAEIIVDIREAMPPKIPNEIAAKELEDIAKLVYEALGQLLCKFWRELRRLTAAFVKSTPRDVGTAILLFLPHELAWDCLHHAHRIYDQFVKNYVQQIENNKNHSLNNNANLQYFEAGRFLRWMLDCRVASIVDTEMAVFLTAVFDTLFNQFLQLLKSDPRLHHWIDQLRAQSSDATARFLSTLAQSRPFSKSLHLLNPMPGTTSSLTALAKMLHHVPLIKLAFPSEFSTVETQIFGEIPVEMAVSEDALLALHFWWNCAECGQSGVELEEWLRKTTIFAVHRQSTQIGRDDVMQAARFLLPNFDCPPPSSLSNSKLTAFPPAIRAILLGHQNCCMENEQHGQAEMMPDFLGWTQLCWAVACERVDLLEKMLLKPGACREVRNQELPLQLCAQLGNLSICELLLRHGANPFKRGQYRLECALALAAARDDLDMLELFLGCCSMARRTSGHQMLLLDLKSGKSVEKAEKSDGMAKPRSLLDSSLKFALLAPSEKRAFEEAARLAGEVGRHELVLKFCTAGVPWPNAGVWLECLEWTVERGNEGAWVDLLDAFGPKMAEQLASGRQGQRKVERVGQMLFQLLSTKHGPVSEPSPASLPTQLQLSTARALSAQFQHLQQGSLTQLERQFSAYFPGHAQQQAQPMPQIDPKFVDCPELSDIRFRFADGQVVFGHRIVLVNASEQFRLMLRSPSGVVEVPNANADSFRLLLEFVYGNVAKCSAQLGRASLEAQIELLRLAQRFGVEKLADTAQKAIGAGLAVGLFARILGIAKSIGPTNNTLLEECHHFALLHLPELLQEKAIKIEAMNGEWKALLERMKAQFLAAVREAR